MHILSLYSDGSTQLLFYEECFFKLLSLTVLHNRFSVVVYDAHFKIIAGYIATTCILFSLNLSPGFSWFQKLIRGYNSRH